MLPWLAGNLLWLEQEILSVTQDQVLYERERNSTYRIRLRCRCVVVRVGLYKGNR
jgi:hypothetical protein